jgi:hypothetical protein
VQYVLFYFLISMYKNNNAFYVLFYFIGIVALIGIFLSLYNLEIFTAFLWMTEVIVILVSLFLIFNTSPSGYTQRLNSNEVSLKDYSLITIGLFVSVLPSSNSYSEVIYSSNFIEIMIWDDFYEALSNTNSNDLYGFFLSYYYINSFEFLVVGLCLLVASLAYVNLNRFLYGEKAYTYSNTLTIFDFFKNLKKSLFLRKQNLVDQENTVSSTRKFKKK